tara:strand:+ start:170 stop:1081 length:912 start_codon:yes stop_codon:yes gene_type:complete
MSDLITIDTNNYAAMAKAMGIAGEDSSAPKKSSTLPRLKIQHKPLMGEGEMNGKSVKLEVVDGGNYSLDPLDGNIVYGSSATIRPFMQRYMYKRYIPNLTAKAGDKKGDYVKTVMADSLNIDLKDTSGGFNCGKPAGYVKDFQSLPTHQQDLLKSIKRVRAIFGLVTLNDAKTASGKPVDLPESPFIWEIDNRDAFKTMGVPFTKLAQMKRLPVQHNITLTTEGKKSNNGDTFYLPQASLDTTTTVDLSDDDQNTFQDFMSWIRNYNEWVINTWSEKSTKDISQSDKDTVDSFINIDSQEEVA